jgi:hypothetical protein
MSESKGTDRQNLTGVWHGLYTYPGDQGSVFFVATLIESGSSLSGSTYEPCAGADCPTGTLFALLSGSRNAGAVTFVKTYERGGHRFQHPITYAGSLNADATEIEGRWNISRSGSGKFLMIRSAGRAETVERKTVAKV